MFNFSKGIFVKAAIVIGISFGGFSFEGQAQDSSDKGFAGRAGELRQKEQEKSDLSANKWNYVKRLGKGSCGDDCFKADPKKVCGSKANKNEVEFCMKQCDGKWNIPGKNAKFSLKGKCDAFCGACKSSNTVCEHAKEKADCVHVCGADFDVEKKCPSSMTAKGGKMMGKIFGK